MGKLCMEKQLLQLVLFLNVGFSFITCQTSTSLPGTGDNVTSLSISSAIASSSYSDVLSESLVRTTLLDVQTSYHTDVPGTESSFQLSTGENSMSQSNTNGMLTTNVETPITSSTVDVELSTQSVYVPTMDSNILSSSMTPSLPLVQTTTSVVSVSLVSTLSVTNSTSLIDSINPSSSNLSQGIESFDPSITLSTTISSLVASGVSEISGTSMGEASTMSESIFTSSQIQDIQTTIAETPAFSSTMLPSISSQTENITLLTESLVTATTVTDIIPTSSLLLLTSVSDLTSSTSSMFSSNDSSLNVIISDPTSSLIDTTLVSSSQSESLITSDALSSMFSSDSIFSEIGSTADNLYPTSATTMRSSVVESIYLSSAISSNDLLTSSESSGFFSSLDDSSSMSVSEYSDVMQSLTSLSSLSVMDESYTDSYTTTDSVVDGTTMIPDLETSSLKDVSLSSEIVNVPSSMQTTLIPSTSTETTIRPTSSQSVLMSSSSTQIVIEPSSMQSYPISSSSVIVEGPQRHNSGGLTSGEKAAIGICIPIVIIICLAGLIYYLYRRKYHVASWKLSDVVSYRPWSYTNASYYDDESSLIIPSL